MPRLAANLSLMFTEWPFLERFKAAADTGFTAVEYLFPYDHPAEAVAEAREAAGLAQALFNLPPGDWSKGERGLAALPARKADFRASLDLAITYGRAIGTPNLHMMAGLADPADATARATYLDNLRLAADRTAESGIALLVEPINRRDMPGYFLSDFDLAADLTAAADHPNIRLQFDIYHRQIIRGDVLKGLEEWLPLIGHVQIAAVPHRHEPGTGEMDDFHILRTLDGLGYTGYVGCEYRPRAGTLEGLGWIKRLGDEV